MFIQYFYFHYLLQYYHYSLPPYSEDITLILYQFLSVALYHFTSVANTQDEFGLRWVIESMHREIKQLTGIERCQCRKQRIQRNHISYAFLVWAFLKRTANKIGKTVYQIKLGLLDDYMQQQLRSPSLRYLEPNIA
ncbi:transposase [Rickettsia endosymbiont of Pantilius tunicatus]|uniref:transposase n=1 Tax=Rickettsia endosymbiont of Pantilius tunicatus TaxID=3066267 RepID=UPI00376EF405